MRSMVPLSSVDQFVCGRCQEVGEVIAQRYVLEYLACLLDPLGERAPLLCLHHLGGETTHGRFVHDLAVVGGHPVALPLPYLGPGDLCGGGILHEVVEGDGSGADRKSTRLNSSH